MIDPSSKRDSRSALSWLYLALAVFPPVALLTYDWHVVTALQTPPAPSSNWIGATGDCFAYYGYLLFGLSVWAIPVACVLAAFVKIAGRRVLTWVRLAWMVVAMVSLASLVQMMQGHAPGVDAMMTSVNIAAAGGVVGYLMMTRLLEPLIGSFGAGLLMGGFLIVSFVAIVGARNLLRLFIGLFRWASDSRTKESSVEIDREAPPPQTDEPEERPMTERARRRAEREARQQEKLAAQQRMEEERRAQMEAVRAAREAAKAARAKAKEVPARQTSPSASSPSASTPSTPAAGGASASPATPADKGPYVLPSVNLLAPLKKSQADHSDVNEMSQRLVDTLKLFDIDAKIAYNVMGPVVTKYAVELAPGTRYAAVTSISDNLMGALRAKSLRIEAPIPGEDCVGIEVPNRAPAGISFREIFESDAWKNTKAELPLLFGKRADGKELVADLASMPHMLVAGATGQGKSVCLNSLICGLLMTRTPEQLKLIMVDPKCVEFTPYASIPHLLVPVITDNKKVVFSLTWAVAEMEKRLKLFSRARVRNIYDFNHRKSFTQTDMFGNDTEFGSDMPKTVPYIVIIIDEAADLIGQCGKEVNPSIQRITQKARAAGIHLILATQRPDAKIITGAIKANIPGRVAFKTSSATDSRTILDDGGAENLIGKGDMLFRGKDGLLIRAQGAWISDEEIANVTSFIAQHADTQFDDRFTKKLSTIKEAEVDIFAEGDDEEQAAAAKEEAQAQKQLVKAAADADDFKKAVECVINTHRASTSHFQRQMGWGYNHAAKILDMLTERGVVSPPQGMGPRSIVMDQDQLIALLNGGDESKEGGGSTDAGGNPADDSDQLFTSVTEEQA